MLNTMFNVDWPFTCVWLSFVSFSLVSKKTTFFSKCLQKVKDYVFFRCILIYLITSIQILFSRIVKAPLKPYIACHLSWSQTALCVNSYTGTGNYDGCSAAIRCHFVNMVCLRHLSIALIFFVNELFSTVYSAFMHPLLHSNMKESVTAKENVHRLIFLLVYGKYINCTRVILSALFVFMYHSCSKLFVFWPSPHSFHTFVHVTHLHKLEHFKKGNEVFGSQRANHICEVIVYKLTVDMCSIWVFISEGLEMRAVQSNWSSGSNGGIWTCIWS